MTTKKKSATKEKKAPFKKLEAFTSDDIKEIIRMGKDKYTLTEISSMLKFNRKGVASVLAEHHIVVPKKPNNIQRLYDQGKVNSNQFYVEATSLIKSRLMPDLIYRGYFKDGQRQISYDIEDVEDCYTYILGKILSKYDPSRGTLATFIRTWVRGYGTTITTAQHRRYNKVGNDSSLDESYNNSICEEFRDNFSFEELENSLDNSYFGEDMNFTKIMEKEMKELKAVLFNETLKGLLD